MKILLDNVDITADIMKQANIPNLAGGVYPNTGTTWYNLLPIVEAHAELKDLWSKGGLRHLVIQGDASDRFDAKIILRLCYSARNS